MSAPHDKLSIGRIGRPHGVRGWIRILSFTDPPSQIFSYSPWWIEREGHWHRRQVSAHKTVGKHFVAKLPGYDDYDSAQALTHACITIERHQLPSLAKGDYYWTDLENLTVVTNTGRTLGTVDHLFATGTNDVIVVQKTKPYTTYFIPYTDEAVLDIDLKSGIITVNNEVKILASP